MGCPFKSAKTFSMLRFNTKVFHLTFNIQASRPLKTKFFIRRSQLLLRVEFPSEFSKNSTVRWSFLTGIPTKSRLQKISTFFSLFLQKQMTVEFFRLLQKSGRKSSWLRLSSYCSHSVTNTLISLINVKFTLTDLEKKSTLHTHFHPPRLLLS